MSMFDPENFRKRFIDFVSGRSLVLPGEKVLVSFSGGIDSAVLTILMGWLSKEYNLDVTLGYFDHGLRGKESEEEGRFIERFAAEHGFRLKTGTDKVRENSLDKKISLQESARELRYRFFERLDSEFNYDKIVQGHHEDDQIETVLMRFLQGNDISSMKGIPVIRGKYVRPLLWASRNEIEQYASALKIEHFEDSSNKKTDYLRNRIRLNILPYLREALGTNIDLIINKHGEKFRHYDEVIKDYTERALESLIIKQEKDKIILDINSFKDYFTLLQQNVLFECLDRVKKAEKTYNITDVEKLISFINGTLKCKTLYISKEILVYKENKSLCICNIEDNYFEADVEFGRCYEFDSEGFSIESKILDFHQTADTDSSLITDKLGFDELINEECVKGPLKMRFWREGDSFRPLGMKYKKKLSDLFIDLKIKPDMKRKIPILLDEEKIIWICGIRIDDRVKITEETRKVVGLKYKSFCKNV
ncbi:MAG: tRNA lysidine(34) synthetase TilS [bacterium]|nr:tRNA lysidine(34) synthetase TilS [bacterium]